MTDRHSSRNALNSKRLQSSHAGRKGRRTFSLSTDALAYLKELAKEHRSTSEALEKLIREKKEAAEKDRISSNIRGYYDAISEEERTENRAWGEFVVSHLKD
jgi:predicted CopG family antitoxin